jgi:hypothetical protein
MLTVNGSLGFCGGVRGRPEEVGGSWLGPPIDGSGLFSRAVAMIWSSIEDGGGVVFEGWSVGVLDSGDFVSGIILLVGVSSRGEELGIEKWKVESRKVKKEFL